MKNDYDTDLDVMFCWGYGLMILSAVWNQMGKKNRKELDKNN